MIFFKVGNIGYDEAELFSIIEIITHFKRIIIYFQSVGPDLAKFRHFDKTLQVFGKYLTVHFLFGKMLGQLRQIYYIINGQILKNNLTIWSHCLPWS